MSVKQNEKSVTLSLPSGASTQIYFFGAHVISWKTPDGRERLYMSRKSALDGSAPIRGGIPIGWPNAGPGPTPAEVESDPSLEPHSAFSSSGHAFVRTLPWTLFSTSPSNPENSISATFTIDPNTFPDPFPKFAKLHYTVTLSDTSLKTDLRVSNPSNAPDLKFKLILHTYLAVDTDRVKLEGLDGQEYTDNIDSGKVKKWEGGAVTMEKETGMLFAGGRDSLVVRDGSDTINVSWPNIPDVQLWTPRQKAGTLSWSDMEIGDGDRFACVEPGILVEWKGLAPGEEWVGSQILSV